MGQEQPDRGPGEVEPALPAAVSRPVLLTNMSELDAIRGKLEEPVYGALFEAVVSLARSNPADVTSPLAAAADVDPRFSDIGWQLMGLESVLPAAGVAWQLTGDNSYRNAAQELLKTAMGWQRWSDGRHEVVDGHYNAAPETASGMRAFAWALDLFAGGLPKELERSCRKKLAYFAQRLTELSNEKATRWAANDSDDWSATMHSAIGHAALALYETDERAGEWLSLAIARILAYLDSLPEDGGHPSGVSRWEFALTQCCFFLEALYRTTEADIRRHPAIERTRRFAVRCLAPGARDIVQLDQGMPLDVSNVTAGPLSKLLAGWFTDPVLGWALANTPRTGFVQAQDLLWYDSSIPRESPAGAGEGSVVFSEIGWAVMRSGWEAKDNLVAFKSAPYWPGYHHLDQNSFVIYGHGHELALDSGLGWRAHPNYFERYRDSFAHNVVLVGGRGQLKHTADSHGELLEWALSDEADYVVGECARAYEDVSRFTRAILFLKPDVIVLRDIIDLDRVLSTDWLMHGCGDFEVHMHESDHGFSLRAESVVLQGFVLQPRRWKHSLHRGYRLADWQTRHEDTHPVLVMTPEKFGRHEFLIVMKIDSPDAARELPGQVMRDGSLLLNVGGRSWSVSLSEDGLDYSQVEASA